MSDTTTFSAMLAAVEPKPDRGHGFYVAKVTEDWQQGRAGFGGLMAALATNALRQEMARLHKADESLQLNSRALRAMMTAFIGPPAVGEIDIQVSVLRSGRSATWAEARITQSGAVCTTITACFGGSRESSISIKAEDREVVRTPEESTEFPFIPGITPNFTQHYEMRWAVGGMPMSGSKEAKVGAWVRYRGEEQFNEEHLVAMMDVLPPAVLPMLTEMKPISSLTWHLELLGDLTAADANDAEGFWYFDVEATATADGYSQQQATLYTPSGRAIAYSQQSIAVFG